MQLSSRRERSTEPSIRHCRPRTTFVEKIVYKDKRKKQRPSDGVGTGSGLKEVASEVVKLRCYHAAKQATATRNV